MMRTNTSTSKQWFLAFATLAACSFSVWLVRATISADVAHVEPSQTVALEVHTGPNLDRALESLAAAWRDENRNRK